MLDQLKEDISKKYSNITFDLKDWDDVINQSSEVSVFYLKSMVDYYNSYFEAQNFSFLVYMNDQPIGLFPFFVYKESNQWVAKSNVWGVISPLFISTISSRLRKKLEKNIAEIALYIAKNLKIDRIEIFEHKRHISNWYSYWMSKANNDFLTYHLSINLSQSIEDIRHDFRKSYKPLISKALKIWDVEVCNDNLDNNFEEFRRLHLKVAGRETRNINSWTIQKNQIKNHEAFLVTVKSGKELIGGGFFNYSNFMGLYTVGAYNSELVNESISHVVQMVAILKLKELGCSVYDLGQKSTYLNNAPTSSKEISISYFKEGFAGNLHAQPHLVVFIDE